ncbi:hypothetical protein ACIRLA_28790 [Streptomyces sp. NPDC102364]|uniref:hypothetical protein n=1 Tax=Streptomyces sp. NPDC102364 TaxID=3366161 RepID=UPI00381B4BD2
MAEISYPFNADNADGGTSIVSQTQWQAMAAGWVSDFIDYRLTTAGESMPFTATVVNGRDVQISAGRAWVGGFYYQNTSTKTITIPTNSGGYARKDLIVIRADLSKSAVSLALRQGTAAASPKEPTPTRNRGGVWEMPLYCIDVPAANGALVVNRRAPFTMGTPVAVPWNAPDSAALLPRNSFLIDVDTNTSGGQTEGFVGTDGYVITQHLGRSQTYTPGLINSGSMSASLRTGRWRYIAPNMVWFQATINNTTTKNVEASGSNWRVGLELPVISSGKGIQVIHGYLANPDKKFSMPNMVSITATTHPKSTTLYLSIPNFKTPTEGLDGLRGFPAKSTLSISGVYEANKFNE